MILTVPLSVNLLQNMVTPNIVLIRLWMENSELGAGLQLTTTQSRARDYFQKKNYVNKQSVCDMKNEWAQSAVRRCPVFTSASQLSRVAKINCNCHCSSRSGPALKGTPGLSWLLQRPNHPKTSPDQWHCPSQITPNITNKHNTTISEAPPTTIPKHPRLWWPMALPIPTSQQHNTT